MQTLRLICFNSDFPKIDTFLNLQQFETEPKYSRIVLNTEDREYYYSVKQIGDVWYIITD